jgi:Flp pilus assembly protein TadD
MKRNILNLTLVALLITALTSCNKSLAELSAEYIKVNPVVLENIGGKVNAEITATIPPQYFEKKSILTVTPVLVAATGQEWRGESASFQGEEVKDNYTVVSFENGGTVSMPASFDYDPAMRKSELFLDFSVQRGKKTSTFPRVKVADGVLSTVGLLKPEALSMLWGEDTFQRVIQEKQEASIQFLVQQSNIRGSELKAEDVQSLIQRLESASGSTNQKISQVDVISYASPEGSQELNARLAKEREANAMNFINRELKKVKESPNVFSEFTAEDWEGFQSLLEKSDIADKELILRVLSMYKDPEEREREIKNISQAFTQISDEILPQLRRSRLNVTVEIIGKSDEEILALLKSNPDSLNLEERLYAARLQSETVSPEELFVLYKNISEKYPEDYRAFNNMGVARFLQENFKEAQTYFQRAATIDDTATEVQYNMGVIALIKGDLSAAETAFGQAVGIGDDLNEALGVMYMMQGNFPQAETVMQKAPHSNNTAIGKILMGDYDRATEVLDLVQMPDATTYYLKAIVGARSNVKDEVYKNMRAVMMRDEAMGEYAKSDMEFAKYWADAEFMGIVK